MARACAVCDVPLPLPRTGCPPVYCSRTCRTKADNQRRRERAAAAVRARRIREFRGIVDGTAVPWWWSGTVEGARQLLRELEAGDPA